MSDKLLILHDEASSPEPGLIQLLVDEEGFSCEQRSWKSFGPEILRQTDVRLVIAVADEERTRAISLFGWLRENAGPPTSLAVVPSGADAELVRAAADAADDFIFAPFQREELRCRIKRLVGARRAHNNSLLLLLTGELGLAEIIGEEPVFIRVVEKIPHIAASDAPVLLTGETGTGKELCARAIHHLSRRCHLPFIPVECGAIPEHLVENELFGHARGAFTDAHSDQRGLIAMADGGTLFLDEVDNLPLAAQAKLLRFLQDKTYRPLGSDRFSRADVHIIAASNRDLEAWVREERFRRDLYFRLNVLRLHLPPLRERREDIPALAHHFLRTICEGAALPCKSFTPPALNLLSRYAWPGNVRELLNVVQCAVAFCPGPQIQASHISIQSPSGDDPRTTARFIQARAAAIATFEKEYLVQILRRHGGNITHAAAEAGKERRAFGKLVKKYQLNPRGL